MHFDYSHQYQMIRLNGLGRVWRIQNIEHVLGTLKNLEQEPELHPLFIVISPNIDLWHVSIITTSMRLVCCRVALFYVLYNMISLRCPYDIEKNYILICFLYDNSQLENVAVLWSIFIKYRIDVLEISCR